MDDRTRGECFKALKNALKQEPLATHGLLFVGTKLLATYSKNKAPDIDPSDMLLLINDFRATFHPYGTRVCVCARVCVVSCRVCVCVVWCGVCCFCSGPCGPGLRLTCGSNGELLQNAK